MMQLDVCRSMSNLLNKRQVCKSRQVVWYKKKTLVFTELGNAVRSGKKKKNPVVFSSHCSVYKFCKNTIQIKKNHLSVQECEFTFSEFKWVLPVTLH